MITFVKKNIFLIFIFFLAFFIRIYSIHTTPLLWDEASLGYNAYSILKTGRDEYGTFLPIIFKSFGDYKPGLYVYLCLPFVYLFGLNDLSVRLPSIILGSLLPIILYFLIKEINTKWFQKLQEMENNSKNFLFTKEEIETIQKYF